MVTLTLRMFVLTFLSILLLKLADGDAVRFLSDEPLQPAQPEERNLGNHLLEFIGLGTGQNVDPYLARSNANCLGGDLAECFKSQALTSFDDFFARQSYTLSPSARIVRMEETQLRSLHNEPYEFSSESRAADSEWDHLVKYALRKVERFIKSTAFEVQIPEEISQDGRYSPRFIDEIADEIDVIEDKKASLFSRNRLKKLFIPLLIILKIFKLKLLLFLPMILGLASFKKILGFAALIIPGVIGYFKLCRPQTNFGNNYSNGVHPAYTQQGLGAASYHGQQHFTSPSIGSNYYRPETHYSESYGNYYRDSGAVEKEASGNIRFGENNNNNGGQDLAYNGYSEYRNKKIES